MLWITSNPSNARFEFSHGFFALWIFFITLVGTLGRQIGDANLDTLPNFREGKTHGLGVQYYSVPKHD